MQTKISSKGTLRMICCFASMSGVGPFRGRRFGKALLTTIIVATMAPESMGAKAAPEASTLPSKVLFSVPTVKQKIGGMCGPACIEMVFRYWGEKRWNQYEIATAIIRSFPDEPRVKRLGLNIDEKKIDWTRYPGTGTRMMREFLKQYAPTRNKSIRSLPSNRDEALKIRDEFFNELKVSVASKIPVIVHQYWRERGTRGHYRVVVGYDDAKQVVRLIDPRSGRITQSYDEFFEKWNVNQDWLPYNSIVFNYNVDDVEQTRRNGFSVDLPQ